MQTFPNELTPRHAEHIRQAKALAKAAADYAERVALHRGQFTQSVEFSRFILTGAIIDLIDDGNALAERESLMHELRIDEQGDPVDADGFPLASFNPSFVHPDDPCQSKGFA